MPEEALGESALALVDAPEVGYTGGGATEASPVDVVTAWTSKLELLASSTIGGSTPKGALVTKDVLLAPIGPTPMVATVDPSTSAELDLVTLGDDPLMWGGNWLH